jgi:hypothetical protein
VCSGVPKERLSLKWRMQSLVSVAVVGGLGALLLSVASLATQPAIQNLAIFDDAKLANAIESRLTRVEEFKALREICAELKVRCWLFGGTAAGYAHYVKWDLLRETGDSRYQPDRFDYDYTNIYRSTQDADLVIDGSVEQAERIEGILRERFKHFQGSKSVWEVRLLHEKRGAWEALLNNPDFLNQHTDSNSTGMIEVTEPLHGESVIRDLRDWTPPKGKQPIFLKDIHEGKLHYYFSPLHATTSRVKAGLNSPILSAIRYLTKAFQYELEIKSEDWRRIQKIINEFDPSKDLTNGYVQTWIEKNGKKLIGHAVNIEYAWNKLEELGLRQKLIQVGDPKVKESLAWWMNKEPLRSRPVGQGSGKTARELGIEIVAHEAKDFLAYESITRAHTGDPNVLISRQNSPGEFAVSGDGFYTAKGRKGAKDTGMTIRFIVDPNAREGEDFFLGPSRNSDLQEGEFIIFRNKKALKVIPESLNITPVGFFRMLAKGVQFESSDRALLAKLKRRIGKRVVIHREELKGIEQIVRAALDRSPFNMVLIDEYLSLQSMGISPNYEVIEPYWSNAIEDHLDFGLGPEKISRDSTVDLLLRKWKPQEEWLSRRLLPELQSHSLLRVERALNVLCAIQMDTPSLVPEILRLLGQPNLAIKIAAAKLLETQNLLGGAVQARAIMNELRNLPSPAGEHYLVLHSLERALKRFAKDDTGAIEVLKEAARDSKKEIRRIAMRQLGFYMTARDPASVRLFMNGIDSTDREIRVASLHALGEIKIQDPKIHLILARKMRDEHVPFDSETRTRAAQVLYEVGPLDDRTIFELLKSWKERQRTRYCPEVRALWNSRHLLPEPIRQRLTRWEPEQVLPKWGASLLMGFEDGYLSVPELQEAIDYYKVKLGQKPFALGQCISNFLEMIF